MADIKSMAVYYQKGTESRNCAICYQSETYLARGLICEKWDLTTSREGVCGEFGARRKPVESEPVKQSELF